MIGLFVVNDRVVIGNTCHSCFRSMLNAGLSCESVQLLGSMMQVQQPEQERVAALVV